MKTIFVGDVHGCREELALLLAKLALGPGDSVVFLGDLVDRGPDPVGCVKLVRSMCDDLGTKVLSRCLLGNHEEKAARFRKHEDRVLAEPGYKNPMKMPKPARRAEWMGLDDADVRFLRGLPAFIFESGNDGVPWLAIHGGLVPGLPVEKQPVGSVIRCRWVDAVTGKNVPMQRGSKERPPGAVDWMSRYDGEAHVVCGHAVHSLGDPRVDTTYSGREVWSIDTGCCFGGHLTALVLDHDKPGSREVVQVKALREYEPLERDLGEDG